MLLSVVGGNTPRSHTSPMPFPGFVRRALVLAIFCVAAFLPLYRLDVPPPEVGADEAMNGSNALENQSMTVCYKGSRSVPGGVYWSSLTRSIPRSRRSASIGAQFRATRSVRSHVSSDRGQLVGYLENDACNAGNSWATSTSAAHLSLGTSVTLLNIGRSGTGLGS